MYSEEDSVIIKYEYGYTLENNDCSLLAIYSDVKTYEGESIQLIKMLGMATSAFSNKPYAPEYVKAMVLLGMNDE